MVDLFKEFVCFITNSTPKTATIYQNSTAVVRLVTKVGRTTRTKHRRARNSLVCLRSKLMKEKFKWNTFTTPKWELMDSARHMIQKIVCHLQCCFNTWKKYIKNNQYATIYFFISHLRTWLPVVTGNFYNRCGWNIERKSWKSDGISMLSKADIRIARTVGKKEKWTEFCFLFNFF